MPKSLEEGIDFLPPLGIMSIAAYIRKHTAHQVEILDCQVEELTYEQVEKEIGRRSPDILGITAMTFTLMDVIKTAKIAKKVNPAVKVVLGGPHVNIYPEETLRTKEIDFLIMGEGEESFRDLVENINALDYYKKIKGLVFRENDQVINNGVAPLISSLDDLPFSARDLTPFKRYFSVLAENPPITTMFTSRGCPYKCLFCDRPHLGKNFRAHSAEYVVLEMEKCKKMGINEIMIYDDTFTVDRQRVVDICKKIIDNELNIVWDVRARVNTVDEKLLNLMARAGCKRIHYGVESGTQKILNVLRKGITLEMVEKAFALSKKVGIQTLGYFIIGSPEETRADIQKTIKFIKKISPDYIHVSIMTPFPATDLYSRALKEGVVKSDVWREFSKNPRTDFVAPIWDKELSREELLGLLTKIYKSFYFRPTFIIKKIFKLKSIKELKTKANAAFKLLKV